MSRHIRTPSNEQAQVFERANDEVRTVSELIHERELSVAIANASELLRKHPMLRGKGARRSPKEKFLRRSVRIALGAKKTSINPPVNTLMGFVEMMHIHGDARVLLNPEVLSSPEPQTLDAP